MMLATRGCLVSNPGGRSLTRHAYLLLKYRHVSPCRCFWGLSSFLIQWLFCQGVKSWCRYPVKESLVWALRNGWGGGNDEERFDYWIASICANRIDRSYNIRSVLPKMRLMWIIVGTLCLSQLSHWDVERKPEKVMMMHCKLSDRSWMNQEWRRESIVDYPNDLFAASKRIKL